MMIEDYIKKFMQVEIQNTISETLGSCLPRRYLNKLEFFEVQKYNDLNVKAFFDKNNSTVDGLMSHLTEALVAKTQKFTKLSQTKA